MTVMYNHWVECQYIKMETHTPITLPIAMELLLILEIPTYVQLQLQLEKRLQPQARRPLLLPTRLTTERSSAEGWTWALHSL